MSIQSLLKEFEHQPTVRWLLLAQQARFRNPAVVKALLQHAYAHRRMDHVQHRAAAESAARLTQAMPDEPALRAQALSELANSHRIREDFESAAGLIGEAEAVLPANARAEICGHVRIVEAGAFRGLAHFESAISAAEKAIDYFRRAGLPLDAALAMILLGGCLTDLRYIEAAKGVFEDARRLLLGEPALEEQLAAGLIQPGPYLAAVGCVQLNGLYVWVQEAEQEVDERSRRRQIDWVLRALDTIHQDIAEKLPKRDLKQMDWAEARALMCIGLYNAAIPRLQRVRAHFEGEARFATAADVGTDLLFAHAALGDLVTTVEEASQMLSKYRERGLAGFRIALLTQISELPKRRERRYLHELKCWPPYSARMPRG